MRIAVFCHNYPPHPGGLEIVVHNLAAGLARDHEVTVVSSAWQGRTGRSEEDGMVVHRLPALHFTEPRGVPWPMPTGPGARAAAREIGTPDLIHAHGALYAHTIWAARLSARARRPLVLTEHVGFVSYPGRILNRVQQAAWATIGDRTIARSDAVVVYNARVRDYLAARYPNRRLEFIRNGVDAERFRPRSDAERLALRHELGLPEEGCLVLFAGREVAKKNLGPVLRMPRTDFTLVVCGAQRNLSGDGIIDLGVVPYARMSAVYGAVDAMIHASTGEGFPLAVQEGMASGLAVAILWDDGYAGNLADDAAEIAHDLDGLAAAVRRITTDADRRAALGRAARRSALERWGWPAAVHAYEALFRELTTSDASDRSRQRGGHRVLP